MTKLNRINLIWDRYATYTSAGSSAERLDRPEVWFFRPTDCRAILTDSRFSARRGGASEKARKRGFLELADFLDDWLMFRDDDIHKTNKKIALRAIADQKKKNWFFKEDFADFSTAGNWTPLKTWPAFALCDSLRMGFGFGEADVRSARVFRFGGSLGGVVGGG